MHGRHEADQAGHHHDKRAEVHQIAPGQPLDRTDHEASAKPNRQEINGRGNGGVIDQRRHPAARHHVEIVLAQEFGHQEGGYPHHRRH